MNVQIFRYINFSTYLDFIKIIIKMLGQNVLHTRGNFEPNLVFYNNLN